MTGSIHVDALDRKILEALRGNSRLSHQDLSKIVGASPSSCWRRVKSLEEAGLLDGYTVLVDETKLGLHEMVFLHISLTTHTEDNVRAFEQLIRKTPEILECYAVTGSHDYILKVVASDMRAYHQFLSDHILNKAFIDKAFTHVTMGRLKRFEGIPASIIPDKTQA